MLTTMLLALSIAQGPSRSVAPGDVQRPAHEVPQEISGVGIEEALGAEIPRDLVFRSATGDEVQLGDLFQDPRPTILTFNYSDCPLLCSVQLNFFAETLAGMRWDLGREYRVITVSLDPEESPARAGRTRERYLGVYGRPLPEGVRGWEFLVGDVSSIRALADRVGFRYARHPDTGEYLHAAALILLTSEQKVSRYLYSIKPSPETLRLSLVEASQGRFTSAIDRALLYCFHYDPKDGKYNLVASNMMRLGAALTVLVLLVIVLRASLRPAPVASSRGPNSGAGDPGGAGHPKEGNRLA